MSLLPGVAWGRILRQADERGSFREVWRASWFVPHGAPAAEPARFVQTNISTSAAGVLRGLHYHRRQLDHWVVLSGRAFVALVDVRPLLAESDRTPLVETRCVEPDDTVTIPAGVAHGFLALEPLQLLYVVTNEYDGTDELGFAWDDPAAAVPWPTLDLTPDGRPILSERDRANLSLRELMGELERGTLAR